MNQRNTTLQNISNISTFAKNGVSTRSQRGLKSNMQAEKTAVNAKRKAEVSPPKEGPVATKRLAFGDLTNNTAKASQNGNGNGKKAASSSKTQRPVFKLKVALDKQNLKPSNKVAPKPTAVTKVIVKTSTVPVNNIAPRKPFTQFGKPLGTIIKADTSIKLKPKTNAEPKRTAVQKETASTIVVNTEKKDVVKTSPEDISFYSSASSSSSSTDSLYVTARDNLSPVDVPTERAAPLARVQPFIQRPLIPAVPANVHDFDLENMDDPFQVSIYAMDIFNYLRERESKFAIVDYMGRQFCLTTSMRALLVDWMVEVQETFELNHETLYLAVKLLDLYLMKMTVGKETLQLIGAAAIFIASKFDERTPPLVDDFLYICDGAYTHQELIKAEMGVIRMVNYDLGIPLSYRFLRRFARCAKVTMPILTLARFVLEYSLMEYSMTFLSDSMVASACLLLALKMKNVSDWTPTLEYYTSYSLEDIRPIAHKLNDMLHRQPKENLSTVRNKYSHKIFFEVAKTPLVHNRQL